MTISAFRTWEQEAERRRDAIAASPLAAEMQRLAADALAEDEARRRGAEARAAEMEARYDRLTLTVARMADEVARLKAGSWDVNWAHFRGEFSVTVTRDDGSEAAVAVEVAPDATWSYVVPAGVAVVAGTGTQPGATVSGRFETTPPGVSWRSMFVFYSALVAQANEGADFLAKEQWMPEEWAAIAEELPDADSLGRHWIPAAEA